MFTFLLEGETSNKATLYYNNSQEKNFSCPQLLFILNLSTKRTIKKKIFLEVEASIRSSYILLILPYY